MNLLAPDSKGVAGERLEFSGLACTAKLQGIVAAGQVFGAQSQNEKLAGSRSFRFDLVASQYLRPFLVLQHHAIVLVCVLTQLKPQFNQASLGRNRSVCSRFRESRTRPGCEEQKQPMWTKNSQEVSGSLSLRKNQLLFQFLAAPALLPPVVAGVVAPSPGNCPAQSEPEQPRFEVAGLCQPSTSNLKTHPRSRPAGHSSMPGSERATLPTMSARAKTLKVLFLFLRLQLQHSFGTLERISASDGARVMTGSVSRSPRGPC